MTRQQIDAERPLNPRAKAIVVGASSGIGAALVQELTQEATIVSALARSAERLEAVCEAANEAAGERRAFAYPHDVTNFDVVPDLFQRIVEEMGGVDLIIYVAAVQPPVAPDEYNFEKDAAMVGVNLLGAMAWLNSAAKRFDRAGGGQIAGVSSISGDRGRAAYPGYHTSKGGLNIYLESLRNRLSRRGVTVTTVKPGFVDTRLLENAEKVFWVISPEEAARQIVEAIHQKRQVVYVPGRWRWVSIVIRLIPSFIFRRLNM